MNTLNVKLENSDFCSDRVLKVTVRSGRGLGKQFIESLEPNDLITGLLGAPPFCGTLFVQLEELLNFQGHPYPSPQGLSTSVLIGHLEGTRVVIKWTLNYPRNLQLISGTHLRSELKLYDGQVYNLSIKENLIKRTPLKVYFYDSVFKFKETAFAEAIRILLR
jgi:CTP-dependent riboflavin kinase